jgi:hypothetical protein
MATLGNSTAPLTGYFYDDTGNSQYMSGAYQMPTGGGYVTDVYVYVNGDGSSTTGQLCIWDWGGALMWNSGNMTFPAGPRTVGGQSWQHVSGLNVWLPYSSNGGYGIGFWAAGGVVWTYESSGFTDYDHGPSSPTTFTAVGHDGSGALGAYALYNPLNPPSVTSDSPTYGPVGQSVTLSGSNFLQITSVTVCGVTASYTVNSSTQITVTVPSGASGTGNITVTNPAGSSSVTFEVVSAPTITNVTPSVATPGTNITITGTNLDHVTNVTIGGVSASYTINSATQITATVPAGVSGNVTVTVTNAAGTASWSIIAGEIWYGTGTSVAAIAAIWYGTGTSVAKIAGVWVNRSGTITNIW